MAAEQPTIVATSIGFRPIGLGEWDWQLGNSPHHDAEPERRPTITTLVAERHLPECYATDNGAALTFFGNAMHEAISDRDGAHVWHLTRRPDGTVHEHPLPTRRLPE